MELSVSVSVAGGVDKQLLFAECLKKWLRWPRARAG